VGALRRECLDHLMSWADLDRPPPPPERKFRRPRRLLQRECSEEVPVYVVAEGKAGGEPAGGVELVMHA
jgi:hypothetical protein